MSKSSGTRKQPMVKVIGKHDSAEAYTIRDFLQRCDVPFEWVGLTSEEEARALVGVETLDDQNLPICIFPDGTRLKNPDIRKITEKLGWFRMPSRTEYDLAIYGAGPAGLSAAVYGSTEGLKTILIERYAIGGQAGSSSRIENYLGFPEGISGADLADRAREQATRFGTEILLAREGVRAVFGTGKLEGILDDGTRINARATICSTGVAYRSLNLPNEAKYFGAGLYYGAGASEAPLTKHEHVFVVGGGNSAGQATMHFASYASKVMLVVRGDSLKSTLSQYLVDRIYAAKNVEVLTQTEVTALHGEASLEAITITNCRTGDSQIVKTHWLFACIGGEPHTAWAEEVGLVRDEGGYLVTGPDLLRNGQRPANWAPARDPYYLETNMPGMFAAGDVRHNSIKRCASAVGEGAMAVAFVHRFLSDG